MADKIKLPPLPIGKDCYEVMSWDDIRARDIEVAKCVLEAAAKACEDGWGGRSSMSDAIRALKVSP